MLNIHYFASVRERLNKDTEQLNLPSNVVTVADLVSHLSTIDGEFKALNDSGSPLLVAVNQTVADSNYELGEDDEVAFFPPMTGG